MPKVQVLIDSNNEQCDTIEENVCELTEVRTRTW